MMRTTHATASVTPLTISTIPVSLCASGCRANQSRMLLGMIGPNNLGEVEEPRTESHARPPRGLDVDGEPHPAVLLEQLDQPPRLCESGRIADRQPGVRPAADFREHLAGFGGRHEQ